MDQHPVTMNGKSAIGLHVPCCQHVPNLSTSLLCNTISISLGSFFSAIGPFAQPQQVGDLGTGDPESKQHVAEKFLQEWSQYIFNYMIWKSIVSNVQLRHSLLGTINVCRSFITGKGKHDLVGNKYVAREWLLSNLCSLYQNNLK